MVHLVTLVDESYCNSVDGKENSYSENSFRTKKMSQEEAREVLKMKDDHYIPSWRAACDAWVTENVEDRAGVHTPVYLLYNAYIRDNPGDYMDIGQFGKVLRSRYPYRKRRRGKQGQQVYVYQDVALKSKLEPVEEDANSSEPASKDRSTPSSSQGVSAGGPSIVVGNNTGGRLLSPLDLVREERESSNSSPTKRKNSEIDVPRAASPKKLKTTYDDAESIDAELQSDQDQSTSGDERYSNTSLCRMAIGRRWIDANLMDTPGQHTYADDICQAYTEDHPYEPLTFTSLALLIRGKYPGRRKKITSGDKTRFVYQDLKLNRTQMGEAVTPSLQELKRPNSVLSPVVAEVASEQTSKTTQRVVQSTSNAPVALPVSKGETATINVPSSRRLAYYPVIQVPTIMEHQSLHFRMNGSHIVDGVLPSGQYLTARGSNFATVKPYTLQDDIRVLDDLLSENNGNGKSSDHIGSSEKGTPSVGKRVNKSSLLHPVEQIRQTHDEHVMKKKNSLSRQAATNSMNVNDYLESELLDINHFNKKVLDYEVSIQVPSGKPVNIPQSIPISSQTTSPGLGVSMSEMQSKVNSISHYTKFRKFPVPGSDAESVSGTSSIGEIEQSNTRVSAPSFINQQIPVVVSDISYENSFGPKRSWDYEMRKGVSPESAWSRGFEIQKSVSPEIRRNENIRKLNLEMKTADFQYPRGTEDRSEYFIHNQQEVVEKDINVPMNNMSLLENKESTVTNICKGNGGSPTSTSPPGAAMHRLEEEIVTSTPQVGEASREGSPCLASTSTYAEDKRSNQNSRFSSTDPKFKEIIKSVISTAKETLSISGKIVDEELMERRLERAVIEENPAVSYGEQGTSDSLSCSVTSALKDLELSSPEEAIELIRHHQSCSGLGCSKSCQTLRAAYVHIAMFRHKCSVWNAFYNFIAKHSRNCRQVSCGVEFCHFVKHELHLNRVSVLPRQLLKERPSLEKEFEICEAMGTHDGDLHCRHLPCPKLPVFLPVRKTNDNQQSKDRDVANRQQSIMYQTISSAFPDTPNGNTVAFHVTKTVKLVKELFRKSTDVR